LTIPTDLTDVDSIYRMKDKVLDTYGRLDALVNNAATSPWQTIEDTSLQTWERVIAVNLTAPFLLSQAFLEPMKKQGRGSIINVTSRSAEIGFVAEAAYCPTKYGIEGLTQCQALEWQPHNIAVNTLGVGAPPGLRLKPTELTLEEADQMPEEVKKLYADDDSMAEAFSEAWSFLALQDAQSITGQRFSTRALAEYLRRNGWEAAIANWSQKLTKAVYVSYDFPESARYQTKEGGFQELKFSFNKKR
jgi:NAD(P)-dependent dehydrogenase (short-subunit alcohol dehydrogenase family)